MKVLITGGTGLLGQALIETSDSDTDICATYTGSYSIPGRKGLAYLNIDVRDKKAMDDLFHSFGPDVVIHTASIGSPDYAEKNRDITWEINVTGTKNIAVLCKEAGIRMVYSSSNGIYDGQKAPYAEDDEALPVNYYGQTKLKGEKVVRESGALAAIVRPILMYGWNSPFERQNVVTMALAKLAKGEKVFVYSDVYSKPLFSRSCSEVIWKIIKTGKYEDFNVGGAERLSVYELVVKAAEVFGLDKGMVVPVSQGFFNELVPRPKDTSYDTSKMENVLGIKPMNLETGLDIMKKVRI
jgi:dTDP-4-dehydrorhamnose reductase